MNQRNEEQREDRRGAERRLFTIKLRDRHSPFLTWNIQLICLVHGHWGPESGYSKGHSCAACISEDFTMIDAVLVILV